MLTTVRCTIRQEFITVHNAMTISTLFRIKAVSCRHLTAAAYTALRLVYQIFKRTFLTHIYEANHVHTIQAIRFALLCCNNRCVCPIHQVAHYSHLWIALSWFLYLSSTQCELTWSTCIHLPCTYHMHPNHYTWVPFTERQFTGQLFTWY